MRSLTGRLFGPIAFAFATDLNAPIDSCSVGPIPQASGDRPLLEPFDDVKSKLVIVCTEKNTEESRPLFQHKPFVSQHPALFVTDVLRVNVLRVLFVQRVDALEEPPLIALAEILLYTLEVPPKEPLVGSVVDPVNVRIFSLDSFL